MGAALGEPVGGIEGCPVATGAASAEALGTGKLALDDGATEVGGVPLGAGDSSASGWQLAISVPTVSVATSAANARTTAPTTRRGEIVFVIAGGG